MEIAKRLQLTEEYYFSKKLREIDDLRKAGKDIINLGIGSPDLPPHPSVIKVLNDESQKPTVHGYQNYRGSLVLRKAFAEWYKKKYNVILDADDEILPLIGSKEGLMHICMTYLNEGDAVLIPNPGYPTYRSTATIAGAICIEYFLHENNNYQTDLDEISKNDLSKVKLMFVNYPQMPTGALPDVQVLKKLVAFAKHNNIVIVYDNPYSFILNEQPFSILNIEGSKEVVIELNSLSKSHNMAGWRVGVLCGSQKHINNILQFKSNMDSGMFLPLQLAAAKGLSLEQAWYDDVNKIYKERKLLAYQLLDKLHCNYSTSQAGLFVWASIPQSYKDGYEFADDILYKHDIFITPGGIFGNAGNQYIRLSLCADVSIYEQAIKKISANIKN